MLSNKICIDELLKMPQDELEHRYGILDGYLRREQRRGRVHYDLEVEACYFARELEWRNGTAESRSFFAKKLRIVLFLIC